MSSGNLGAEFVGRPAERDGGAVGGVVLNRALDQLGLVRGAGVLSRALLPLENSALGLVGERVTSGIVTDRVGLADDLLRLLEVLLAA